jgi:hypothetical protein
MYLCASKEVVYRRTSELKKRPRAQKTVGGWERGDALEIKMPLVA